MFILLLVNLVALSTCQSPGDSDDAVPLMTTMEPIDGEGSVSFKNASSYAGMGENTSCTNISDCSSCKMQDCNWVKCTGAVDGPYCTDTMDGSCSPMPCIEDPCSNFTTCSSCLEGPANCSWVDCGGLGMPFCTSTMAEPCLPTDCSANVTTMAPTPGNTTTTTMSPDTTTTELPTTTTVITTTNPDITTESPNDTTTTTEEPVTTTTTTAVPTTVPTTSSTTSAPPPAPATGGFSAGSFFGGITLTLALLAVGYGGFKFYKTRYDVNYRTL
ncbi:CD164-related protein [Trinorchestia longiramus]|nr:CD164-related protein [Trinorchestia longiramus]